MEKHNPTTFYNSIFIELCVPWVLILTPLWLCFLPLYQSVESFAVPLRFVFGWVSAAAEFWSDETSMHVLCLEISKDFAMFPSRDLAEISTSLSSWLLSNSTVAALSVSGLQDFADPPASSEYDSQKEMLSQQDEFCIRGQASEMSPQVEWEREPRKVGIISPTESEALQKDKRHMVSKAFQKILSVLLLLSLVIIGISRRFNRVILS